MRSLTLSTITILARHWPLASTRQAKRQAIKLIRARDYLDSRGIVVTAVNSGFVYSAKPTVLQ